MSFETHYKCYAYRYKGIEDNEDPENATSTYLYAADEKELFDDKSFFNFVNVPQYQETVVPCRYAKPPFGIID